MKCVSLQKCSFRLEEVKCDPYLIKNWNQSLLAASPDSQKLFLIICNFTSNCNFIWKPMKDSLFPFAVEKKMHFNPSWKCQKGCTCFALIGQWISLGTCTPKTKEKELGYMSRPIVSMAKRKYPKLWIIICHSWCY